MVLVANELRVGASFSINGIRTFPLRVTIDPKSYLNRCLLDRRLLERTLPARVRSSEMLVPERSQEMAQYRAQ